MKSKLFNKNLLIAVTAMGLFLASCGHKEHAATSGNTEKVPVKIATANLEDFPMETSFSGKLEADKQSNLSTRIMGQITAIYVKPGQKVNQGDLLIQIRNQDILAKKAQVEASKAEATTAYESAEKDLKRFEALHAANSASDKELDDMRTHFQMAKARVSAVEQMEREVEENIRYSSIRAPYSGIVTTKFVHEGDMANPGMPLISIESPALWKVYARIPELEIASVKLNDPVKVRFTALPGVEVEGTVSELNPSSTNTGSQFEAKILLNANAAKSADLYSGMFATVLHETGTQKMIRVPQSSLVKRGQLTGLYAIGPNNKALLRWVRTGKTYGDSIEILSGLNNGEKYVLSGENKLYDGAIVEYK